jgi:hypothetical protein
VKKIKLLYDQNRAQPMFRLEIVFKIESKDVKDTYFLKFSYTFLMYYVANDDFCKAQTVYGI